MHSCTHKPASTPCVQNTCSGRVALRLHGHVIVVVVIATMERGTCCYLPFCYVAMYPFLCGYVPLCSLVRDVGVVCVFVCVALSNYGGPVGHGCHNVHICDLRTCTQAHLGFADLHICDLRICTNAHLQFVDVYIRNLRTCTYVICGRAHMHMMCMCARPQIAYVHVCISRCACVHICKLQTCTS